MTEELTFASSRSAAGPRPMRVDALRNRARLVEEAARVFAESGVDASLNEIVKRAGVGSGTLYRHFPTREALLEAVLSDRFEALGAYALELLASPLSTETLRVWLRAVIREMTAFPGLASSVMAILDGGGSALAASCGSVRTAGAALLDRMKSAGFVRPEIDISDLLKLVNAIALASQKSPDRVREADRLLGVVLSGVEAPR